MGVYINGIGSISAQLPWIKGQVIGEPKGYSGENVTCIEPDYSQFFDIRQLRRMSRVIKMGMACGIMALREAALEKPDGIITGTSYGCLEDTGTFLTKMIENKEHALNPTPFIQSTHNTIGSQIALLLQCQGYNQTYTQRAFSFENALVDAMLALEDSPDQSILTGAADEITATSHNILKRFDLFKSLPDSLGLFNAKGPGTINGEGAAYFVLSGERRVNAVELVTVNMLFKPDGEALRQGIKMFLESASLSQEDIDLVLIGKSGDVDSDQGPHEIVNTIFADSSVSLFKHLTGEFPTVSALAMSLACRIIQEQHVPEISIERNMHRVPRNVLVYNTYLDIYHSLILLRA